MDFCDCYSTRSTWKTVCDYGGAVCTAFILGPHADVIGLIGKCKLFMDVANKKTLGLTCMVFLFSANYLGQCPLYP